jgi:hypothetical protein
MREWLSFLEVKNSNYTVDASWPVGVDQKGV